MGGVPAGDHFVGPVCGFSVAWTARVRCNLKAVRHRLSVIAVALLATASACASDRHVPRLYDAQRGVERYITSGDYDRDFAHVVGEARAWLEQRAKTATRPAIVLDIDE